MIERPSTREREAFFLFDRSDVKILASTHCLGLDRQHSSSACLLGRASIGSALGLCSFSSLAQASTPRCLGGV